MKKVPLSVLVACGMMSAHAAVFNYNVTLNGANESPANGSPGQGIGTVSYDNVAHTLQMQVLFLGLIATNVTTQAHIHGPTVNPFTGTASVVITPGTLPGFPLGVTSGSYTRTLDMTLASTYSAAYVTANGGTVAGAEAAWAIAMAEGRTYFNIHTGAIPGGEIRGFLTAVPEPSTLALAGLGLVGLAARVWNKRRAKKS